MINNWRRIVREQYNQSNEGLTFFEEIRVASKLSEFKFAID